MVKAVEANTDEQRWVVLYVKRWLAAPLQLPDGTLRAGPRNSTRVCGFTRAGEPVHALRVRHLAGTGVPGRWSSSATRTTRWCTARPSGRPAQVLDALAERMDEVGLRLHPDKTKIVYCKDDKRRGLARAHVVYVPGVHLPPAQRADARTGRCSRLPARGQPGGAEEDERRGPPLADPPAHRHDLDRDRRADQPGRGGLDELLRPVLPVAAVSPPPAHQHLPDALGTAEISSGCAPSRRSHRWWRGLLDREPTLFAHWAWARDVSTWLDEKSGVTGDCHAPFCGSPEVRSLRATRLVRDHRCSPRRL